MTVITFWGLGDISEKVILNLSYHNEIVLNIFTRKNRPLEIEEFFKIKNFKNRQFFVNNNELLKDSDFIFITSAHKDSHLYSSRREMIDLNYSIVKNVLDNIFDSIGGNYSGKIILITNPTEDMLNRYYLETGRHSHLFGLGTHIDTIRYNWIFDENKELYGVHGEELYIRGTQDRILDFEMEALNNHVSHICSSSNSLKATLGCVAVISNLIESFHNNDNIEKNLRMLSWFNGKKFTWESPQN